MKGEINRDYYCSAMLYKGACLPRNTLQMEYECESRCPNHHRKWPTPQQFKEEYGEDYQNDCPAWFVSKDDSGIDWCLVNYGYTKRFDNMFVVCACTMWGKPPSGWRPE